MSDSSSPPSSGSGPAYEDTCIAWGKHAPREPHPSCPVVIHDVSQIPGNVLHVPGPLPRVCPCECRTCQRAWWSQGRPRRMPDGTIRRHTPTTPAP